MKNKRFLATSFLIVLLSAARAWAGHVVWVDFSGFHLDSWSEVNGNKPPKSTDLDAIRKLILANVTEDYATFDITFTTSKPPNGRYTWVKVLGVNIPEVGGCSGSECCQEGDCTGIGSWDDMTESALEVYAGSFANKFEFVGPKATTARIARGVGGTVSHEVGHILGLEHCNAADDSIALGCENAKMNTSDKNTRWHTMASPVSWGLTFEEQATRDRFFSVHSERRILASAVQLRNHFAPLANVNGGEGLADLLYGRLASPSITKWFVRTSDHSAFGSASTWAGDAGDAGDIFLTGDVDKDGRADLVIGRIVAPMQVTWWVRTSNGSSFDPYSEWAGDAGDAGDIFRLADVNKDGRADLVYGRSLGPGIVRWFVRKSDGSNFGSVSTWASDAGDVGDLFFVADVDNDKRADLVYARAVSPTQVKWFVRRSDGSKFGSLETWHADAGDKGDLLYVGNVNGLGGADLVYGRVKSSFGVTWRFHPSTGFDFGAVETWANDAGDAGDLFRLGDGTGDGQLDLIYGRPLGLTSLTATPNPASIRWYGRSSQGTSFSAVSTWASDAGDEGDCFP
jgi:FG-GAP-like repeat